MGKKYTQFNEDTAPTDDDILLGVDVTTGLTKRFTRQSLLSVNPIVNPTIENDSNGDIFLGKNNGWTDSGLVISTYQSDGQKQYIIKVASQDVTDQIYKNQKIKITRGVTAPTQCTDLEATTLQQYWTKATPTGFAFTDDFSEEAWIKPESYQSNAGICGRGSAGEWNMRLNSNGQIEIYGINASSNGKIVTSHQSIPLGRWSHIAATLDMSGGVGTTYIDGVSVPNGIANLAAGATSLVQSGDLYVGKNPGSGAYFDGKICEVRVWSAIRTAAQIRDNANQQLTGSETNLVGYWKFNGNGNDSTSNANNLTATGTGTTPTATSADNPMHDTEYGVVTDVTFSTHTYITVFTGTDHNIPNISISDLYFSNDRAPAGFPAARKKWRVETIKNVRDVQNSPSSGTWYNMTQTSGTVGGFRLSIPIGHWAAGYEVNLFMSRGSNGTVSGYLGMSTANNTAGESKFLGRLYNNATANASMDLAATLKRENSLFLDAATDYYLNASVDVVSLSNVQLLGDQVLNIMYAELDTL